MARLHLKNTKLIDGRWYFRRKVGGKDIYVRLPDPGSPDFHLKYEELRAHVDDRPATVPGSIADLIAAYRKSSEFTKNKASTRKNQSRYLDMLATEHGHRSVRGIEEKHVVLMRDRLQGTPGKANNLLTVLKRLLNYAIRPLKLRTDNPAAGVKLLAIGENEPWPERLLQTCLEVADPMMRLVIIQGACSGLRISDTIRVRHDWHDGRTMRARTKKTSQIVYIPMHPDWLAEIAKVPPVGPTILYNSLGKPWNDKSLQSRIRELMADPRVVAVRDELVQSGEIEEDMRFTHHGLRKNACCYLLECGLSDAAVGAILAMSPEMVRHYGKRVLNKQLAENAAKAINSNSVIPAAARGQTVER